MSIPALIGEQMAIHVRPITDRLDRMETNQHDYQETQAKRLGNLEATCARLDERTHRS